MTWCDVGGSSDATGSSARMMPGLLGERPSDAHALLLATRQVGGTDPCLVHDADALERLEAELEVARPTSDRAASARSGVACSRPMSTLSMTDARLTRLKPWKIMPMPARISRSSRPDALPHPGRPPAPSPT